MKPKEVVETAVRDNVFELKNEAQRMKDYLKTVEPGTEEYEKGSKLYLEYVKSEKEIENKSIKKELIKIGAGVFAVGICVTGLRKNMDKTYDPFFKENATKIIATGLKLLGL